MFALRIFGALLVLAGVGYCAWAAIRQGRMSEPGPTGSSHSLEPRRSGLRAFGMGAIWPGLAMIGAGAVMLLLPLLVATPQP